MQVYGLFGQTEEGIWPEAQPFSFRGLTNQSVNLHIVLKSMFYLLYYTESLKKSFYPFVAVLLTILCF